MYFSQSIIHGRAKHGVRGLALQRSPPVPALRPPHYEPTTAGRSTQKGWEEGTEKGQKREEETEPKQCAMSAIEDMYPVVCFDSKYQFHNDIIPVTVHIRLFFAIGRAGLLGERKDG